MEHFTGKAGGLADRQPCLAQPARRLQAMPLLFLSAMVLAAALSVAPLRMCPISST